MTYKQAYDNAVAELKAYNPTEAEIDVWYAMERVSYISRAKWFVVNRDEMPEAQYKAFRSYVKRLKKAEPISYILGESVFCGFEFKVDKNVLIPRQDTELLVEEVVKDVELTKDDRPYTCILDMCTGSGCIIISLKLLLERKDITTFCTASDISEAALNVAKANASRNEAAINFIQGDLFEKCDDRYDIITCNPPYITKNDMDGLDKKVYDYEPHLALYGGEDGLDFYRRIAEEAKNYLLPFGKLYLEIGYDQGETVPELLKKAGYHDIEVKKDYNHLDRLVVATY